MQEGVWSLPDVWVLSRTVLRWLPHCCPHSCTLKSWTLPCSNPGGTVTLQIAVCHEIPGNLIVTCAAVKVFRRVTPFSTSNSGMNSGEPCTLKPRAHLGCPHSKLLGSCEYDISAIQKLLITLSKFRRCFFLSPQPLPRAFGWRHAPGKKCGDAQRERMCHLCNGGIAGARLLHDLGADMFPPSCYKWFPPWLVVCLTTSAWMA